MDFLNGGELFYHLKQVKGGFNEERARFYAAEIALALQYLHKSGVVYRDLKPENILFYNNTHASKVLVVDFGLSEYEEELDKESPVCGTATYLAPEVIIKKILFQCYKNILQ